MQVATNFHGGNVWTEPGVADPTIDRPRTSTALGDPRRTAHQCWCWLR